MILVYYLGRRTYLKMKYKVPEQITKQVSEQVSNHDCSETKHKEPKCSNNSSRSITTKPKPPLSRYDLERYAVMCNADLEHKDEMEQYK